MIKTLLKWVGGITAVIGLITAMSGLIGPLKGWWAHGRQNKIMLTAALHQEEVGEYPAAFDTLSEILKNDPANVAVLRTRLDVTMLWIENIWAPTRVTDDVAQEVQPIFARMSPVLEAGLGSDKDYRAADVLAHLAWLNLLKEKILNEDGLIEEHLQRALKMDPTNVYANAMIGDWILETHGNLDDARAHFAAAFKTGKVKTFVRSCQLQSMIYNESPGVRAELIRVANEMRKDGESLGEDRSRIHSYYSPTLGEDSELQEVVSAVPPDEAWATYRWLCPPDDPADSQEGRFIQANIDEVSGKKAEAVQLYLQLAKETEGSPARVGQRVRAALKRLGH